MTDWYWKFWKLIETPIATTEQQKASGTLHSWAQYMLIFEIAVEAVETEEMADRLCTAIGGVPYHISLHLRDFHSITPLGDERPIFVAAAKIVSDRFWAAYEKLKAKTSHKGGC